MTRLLEMSMQMRRALLSLTLVAAGVASAQSVPTRLTFSARMVDSGAPVQGNRDFIFKLFPTVVGGTEVWSETRNAVNVVDGAVNLDLGASMPLTDTVFDGQTLYLEVTVGGVALSPRTPVLSVPYALRANVAAQVGTLTPANIQRRVSSACGAGAAIQTINADGTVVCQAVGANDAGVTTITNITAGAGLTGGGSTGNVSLAVGFGGSGTSTTVSRSDHNHTGTYLPLGPVLACSGTDKVVSIAANGSVVCAADPDTNTTYGALANGGLSLSAGNQFSLVTCPAGQSLVAGAAGAWTCAAPSSSGVTSVGAATPLVSSGGTTPSISLAPCPAGQLYKFAAGGWGCAPDDNTVLSGAAPITVGGGAVGLAVCPNPGDVYKMSGGSWRCAADSNSGGTVTAVTASAPLVSSGGAAPNLSLGVVPIANGGTGVALGSTSGGPGQVVKQTTAGGPFNVGALTAGELPMGTQVWPTLPSCPSGTFLQGIANNGTPNCVGPTPVDSYFNITTNAFGGAYAAVYVYCFSASCNIPVTGSSFYATGSTTGTVTVTRNSVGNYSVNIPWMNSTAVSQITTYSGSPGVTCKSGSFTGPNFTVQCFNLFP